MADSKITALASISTSTDPAVDPLVIVDVSDTSMAASGTSKKVTLNNLLSSSPTATGAFTVSGLVTAGSATITGDLTVDTSTLKVDSTNNRVGIGTASPLYPLHLVGEFGLEEASAGNGTKLRLIGDASKYNFRLGKQLTATNTFEITPSTAIGGTTFSNPVYTVTYDGTHTFLDGAGGTRMTLNSTGLGIGNTPIGKFDVYNTVSDTTVFIRSDTTKLGQIVFRDNADSANQGLVRYDHLNDRLSFTANGAENLYLLSTGNLSVTSGNVVMATSGKGIDFSATANSSGTMTSELLNDYEEGTFTPTIVGNTIAGVGVYVNQVGTYTKIGNQVTVWANIEWSSHTGTGTQMYIGGLPFNVRVLAGYNAYAALGYITNIALTAGNFPLIMAGNSDNFARFFQSPTGGGAATAVPMDTAGQVGFSMTYNV